VVKVRHWHFRSLLDHFDSSLLRNGKIRRSFYKVNLFWNLIEITYFASFNQ
ncbi:hypothetical protein RYX36_019444, partial [Vicia faba]